MTVSILHRDDLALGGFAGLTEHRLVMDRKAWGDRANPDAWAGLGSFVYLADARFQPHGETRMHDHMEIDVITVMVEGRIAHEGSLEHGQSLETGDVQVQRAGGEGFSHNEINPDDTENRLLQVWFTPETAGEPAAYKFYPPAPGVTRVYGGDGAENDTFASRTTMDVAVLAAGEDAAFDGPVMAYVAGGKGVVDGGTAVEDGDLIRADGLAFRATTEARLIVIGAAGPNRPPID